jgi:hypothetical protein
MIKPNKIISDNIDFLLEETPNTDSNKNIEEIDINELLIQINSETGYNDDIILPQIVHYNENYTVKELIVICDYYGFSKEIKTNKCNKEQIIEILVNFENDNANNEIVFKRQTLWFYINELKEDKFMKKFILW